MLTALVALLVGSGPLVSETKCGRFSLVVTSPSGVPTEDDGRLEVVVAGQRLAVKLAQAMYTFGDEHPSFHAPAPLCPKEAAAHELEPGLVLVVLTRSGRPGLDRLSLVLVDLKRREVLDARDTDFELARPRLVTRAAKGGLELRAVREWLPGDDSLDGAMEDWLAITVAVVATDGGPGRKHLDAHWLRP